MYFPDQRPSNICTELNIKGVTVPIELMADSPYGILYLGDGTNTDLSTPIKEVLDVDILSRNYVFLPTTSCLSVFNTIHQVLTEEGAKQVDSCPIRCDVVVVPAHIFGKIAPNIPEWVGTCQRDGLVLYDSQYVNRILTSGDPDNIGYFVEEMHHEVLHSYIDGLFPELRFPLPLLEGLIEGIARKNPSISPQFLRECARVFIERDGDFCWDTMMKGFWQYGNERVDSHPAYQFSRLTVDRIVDEINRMSQNVTRPFERIFSLISQYHEGGYAKNQIPFLFFLEYATGLNIDKIQLDILTE